MLHRGDALPLQSKLRRADRRCGARRTPRAGLGAAVVARAGGAARHQPQHRHGGFPAADGRRLPRGAPAQRRVRGAERAAAACRSGRARTAARIAPSRGPDWGARVAALAGRPADARQAGALARLRLPVRLRQPRRRAVPDRGLPRVLRAAAGALAAAALDVRLRERATCPTWSSRSARACCRSAACSRSPTRSSSPSARSTRTTCWPRRCSMRRRGSASRSPAIRTHATASRCAALAILELPVDGEGLVVEAMPALDYALRHALAPEPDDGDALARAPPLAAEPRPRSRTSSSSRTTTRPRTCTPARRCRRSRASTAAAASSTSARCRRACRRCCASATSSRRAR